MSTYTIFNGHTLDDEVEGFWTLSVEGERFAGVAVDASENPGDGSTLLSRRTPAREIKVKFAIQASGDAAITAQNALQKILYTKQSCQLITHREPGVYFNALCTGIELDEDMRTARNGTITFECYDPFKYSIETKSFKVTQAQSYAGNPSIPIENNGNVAVPITYEATMASDNGYMGLMQRDTGEIMQFGYLEEADGETYTESETLLDTAAMFSAANDASGTACVSDPTFTVNGSLGEFTPSESSRKWLGLKTDVSATGWHGGQRTIEIPADSTGVSGAANFFCYFRRWFQKGKVKQLGFQSIFFLDENKNPICGTRLGAYNAGDWNTSLDFVIGSQKVKTIKGTANDQNSSMWRESNGHDALTKEGSKFTFHYAGKYYSFVNDDYADTAIRYIQINISNYSTYEQMTRNYLGVLTFTKNNVSKWQDNPNRYASGDVIRIDGSEGKVYVNDLVRMGDEIMGTEYFKAQPGLTVVRVYQSSWASDLDITATIREAWL